MTSTKNVAEGSGTPPCSTVVTMRLIEQWGTARAAEFIVGLQQAVDGLSSNNKAFADAFQLAIEKQYRLESSLREFVAAMRDYEMIADGDPTWKHRDMMERAELALQ